MGVPPVPEVTVQTRCLTPNGSQALIGDVAIKDVKLVFLTTRQVWRGLDKPIQPGCPK